MKTTLLSLLTTVFLVAGARAEWRVESFLLQPGWNGIYPAIDASHVTLDDLLSAYPGVEEVWRWQPERADARLPGDITKSPTGLEWDTWVRGQPGNTSFTRLTANYGYLVRLEADAPLTVSIKGRAVLPEVRWRGDGLSLVGFPVNNAAPPTFSSYLAPTGFAQGNVEIFRYVGGNIKKNRNPAAVVPAVDLIERGQAYWIRANQFSRYYGPLKIELTGGEKVSFGTISGTESVLLTNQSSASVTCSFGAVASEAAPTPYPFVEGPVPLLLKTDTDTDFAPLSGIRTLTLEPGAIARVQLTVDRTLLTGEVGAHYASLLQFTTTAGIAGEEVYVPVTAEVGSSAGLWIGEAEVTKVGSVAIRYERDAQGNTVYDDQGRPGILEDYTTPQSGGTLPGVSKGYPLRVILHVDASGQATLLSHVYQGRLAAAPPEDPFGIVTAESLLDPTDLDNAIRLSVAHLPLNTDHALSGSFSRGGAMTSGALTTVYNQADNPFVHVYHPDHDNLDARFADTLPAGVESFDIRRSLTFAIDAVAPEGASTGWGTTLITGTYAELIEGPYKTPLRVEGIFGLYKVSDIPVLIRP